MTDSRLTILRTVAGSAPCVSQFKEFQKLGVRVVCTDADPLSSGFLFADAAYTVPRATDPAYIPCLVEVCRKENVDWVVPALEEELSPIDAARPMFAEVGARVLLSTGSTLEVCVDKLETFNHFRKAGVPTPATMLASEVSDSSQIASWPQILKPRRGRGSNGISIAHDWEEWTRCGSRTSCFITQEFISGTEYTIDVLSDFNGDPVVISPRRRIATESGISYKGGTEARGDIIDEVGRLCSKLRIVGPANVQCMVDQSDRIWFTEVNARLAGSCILSIAAGVPLLDGIVKMMRGEEPQKCFAAPRDLVMLRYWAESFVDPNAVGDLSHNISQ